MNFLTLFISTFLTNYFFIWIISLFKFRNKRNISAGIISLANLSSIGYYFYDMIMYFKVQNTAMIIYTVGNILAVLIAYIATLILLFDGVKLFKTKRQREFKNAIEGKTSITSTVLVITFSILAAVSIIYAIYLSITYNNVYLWNLIGAYTIGIIFVGLSLFVYYNNKPQKAEQVIEKKIQKVLNRNLIFIIYLKNKKVVFESQYDDNFEELLGDFQRLYVLNNYGIITQNDTAYSVMGVSLEYLDKNTLNTLKMNVCKNEKLLDVVNQFNRFEQKQIIIDVNYNIEKEIKL